MTILAWGIRSESLSEVMSLSAGDVFCEFINVSRSDIGDGLGRKIGDSFPHITTNADTDRQPQ